MFYLVFGNRCFIRILKGTSHYSFETDNLRSVLATYAKPRSYRRKNTNPIIGREKVGSIQ